MALICIGTDENISKWRHLQFLLQHITELILFGALMKAFAVRPAKTFAGWLSMTGVLTILESLWHRG